MSDPRALQASGLGEARTASGQAAARQDLERYRIIASEVRDLVLFLRREDGRILEANQAALDAYGYRRDELLGLTIADLRAPGTAGLTAAQMAEADARGVLFETEHRRRDGSTFPVEVSSRGATVAGVRTLLSVVRDITRRRRAETALRRSEARLRALIESLPQLVWTAGADGRPDAFNAQWRAFTGQGAGVEDWTAALHPAEHDAVTRLWGAAVAAGVPLEVELRLRRADGACRWFLLRAIRLESPGDEPRWLCTGTDVHDLKESQEVLRQAGRLKDDFLHVAAHELRSPLTALQLQAELLRRELAPAAPPGAEQRLAGMEAQLTRLDGLIGLLMDASRMAHGRLELTLEPVDLGALVGEAVARLVPTAERAGVELRCHTTPATGRWDRQRLEQVVVNLVDNAVKYGCARPVEVEAGPAPGGAAVVVRDRGVGIPCADLGRIFERFERGANAGHARGLGLGLWIARSMAELHGGRIEVESTPGAGSTFRILLPLEAPPPT